MRNALTFGGVNSADYGVYITGTGVFNAPARAVEEIAIPGRNGNLAIDQGRFENITLEYPAFAFGKNRKEFRQKIKSFRNAVMSQIGYQRLEDTYHPDEYRMAVYKEGLEVEVGPYGGSGHFTLKFNCKPQRFLKMGEQEISITSGGDLINPTEHDAGPLIMAEGYGTITVGDYEIEIDNVTMGEVLLAKYKASQWSGRQTDSSGSFSIPLGADAVSEDGDTITVNADLTYGVGSVAVSKLLSSSSVTTQPSYGTASWQPDPIDSHRVILKIWNAVLTFAKGTSSSYTLTTVYSIDYQRIGLVATRTATITVSYVVAYDASMDALNLTASYSYTAYDTYDFYMAQLERRVRTAAVESTQSMLGTPTYIDCDLGECYKIEGGSVVDLNGYIDLGSDLPALKPGTNEITYDNTITSLKVVPRWWCL